MPELIIEADVKDFISRLPEIGTEPPTCHLMMLAVRSRFAKALLNCKISDIVVERKIVRPVEEWRFNYFQKVYNLAVLQTSGHYAYKNIGEIPPGCMAIYGTVVPRSVIAANRQMFSEAWEHITRETFWDKEALDGRLYLGRMDLNFFSRLHAHKHRKSATTITIDIDVAEHFAEVRDMLSPLKTWMISRTSRGYHIIKDISKDGAEEFHKGGGIWDRIHAKFGKDVELQRDSQEPIPGTRYMRLEEMDKVHYVQIIE